MTGIYGAIVDAQHASHILVCCNTMYNIHTKQLEYVVVVFFGHFLRIYIFVRFIYLFIIIIIILKLIYIDMSAYCRPLTHTFTASTANPLRGQNSSPTNSSLHRPNFLESTKLHDTASFQCLSIDERIIHISRNLRSTWFAGE